MFQSERSRATTRRQQIQGLWACNLKVKEDQDLSLTVCRGYEDPRLDADLNRENELVDFFTRVMERRKENKWD